MDDKKIAQLMQYIEAADVSLQQARNLLIELGGDKISSHMAKTKARQVAAIHNSNGKVVEGIYDGQDMVGPDGKKYSVPANYASKSKLVEGDLLKLTILDDGSFIYKQIQPIERNRIKGKLMFDEMDGQFSVLTTDGKKYNVLNASVTYFKGNDGDQAIILVPKDKTSKTAAIENILKGGFDKFDKEEQSDRELQEDSLSAEETQTQEDLQQEIDELDLEKFEPQKEKQYSGLTGTAFHDPIMPSLKKDLADI